MSNSGFDKANLLGGKSNRAKKEKNAPFHRPKKPKNIHDACIILKEKTDFFGTSMKYCGHIDQKNHQIPHI